MSDVVDFYVSTAGFMGTVLVARQSDVVFEGAYGHADLEWDIPNTTTTKFQIGSLTKQFTAAAVLLLEERGFLSLRDPVRSLLPDTPASWSGITVFQLLTYTSGIPATDEHLDDITFNRVPRSVEETVARFADMPLDFPPGESFRYSNSGYILLGLLIERLSGESFESFVRENIFSPLGMADSGYGSNTALIPRRARGYRRIGEDLVNADYIHLSVPHAGGALYSTVEDLMRWNQGLYGGELLSQRSLDRMTTPHLGGHAMGIYVDDEDGVRRFWHTGGFKGFTAALHYYPDSGITVAALANIEDSAATTTMPYLLASVAHGEEVVLTSEIAAIDLSVDALRQYVGIYQREPGANFTVTLEDDQLIFQPPNGPRLPLVAESGTRFFTSQRDVQIEFIRDEGDQVIEIVITRPQGQRRGTRLTNGVQ